MQSESSSSNHQPQPSTSTGGNEDNTKVSLDDFVQSGRTGRRNAVPDILNDKSAQVSTADLSGEMEKLACSSN